MVDVPMTRRMQLKDKKTPTDDGIRGRIYRYIGFSAGKPIKETLSGI